MNVYSLRNKKEEKFPLNPESSLHTYWTKSNLQDYGNCMPQAWPVFIHFAGKRSVVLSRYLANERPSVCFHSVETGCDFLRLFGANFLVYMTPTNEWAALSQTHPADQNENHSPTDQSD